MGKIQLNNIRIYAYHGVLEEEKRIGSDYRVDLEVAADLTRASQSDQLIDTLSYVALNTIVKEEMAVHSDLLEHVAGRILDRIFSELLEVTAAEVKVAKINPPVGGDVESAAVVLWGNRPQ